MQVHDGALVLGLRSLLLLSLVMLLFRRLLHDHAEILVHLSHGLARPALIHCPWWRFWPLWSCSAYRLTSLLLLVD